MPLPNIFAQRLPAAFTDVVVGDGALSSNERHLLSLLRSGQADRRTELATRMGLTLQTIGRQVERLEKLGLLRVGETMPQPRGKPAARLLLDAQFACVLGVSITTDSLALALVDFSGVVRAQESHLLKDASVESLIVDVDSGLHRLLTVSGFEQERVFGIGVGMTGGFIGEGRKMNPPPPLDGLALLELDIALADALQLPVWIDNDGSMAAIGESLLGVGRRFASFAYLHFAHGFGGGLVLDGRCVRGQHGNAGEFSTMLPGLGLQRPALEPLRQRLVEEGLNLPDINALVTGFDPAWPGVEAWIRDVLPGLNLITSAIAAVLDPPAIVFGGRIPPALGHALMARVRLDNPPRRGLGRPLPQLLLAEAPQDAIAIGAASQVLKAGFFDW